jgi:hypothetical protein
VDVSPQPFRLAIDESSLPHAAARLRHLDLPRYPLGDDCLPVTLTRGDATAVASAVSGFLRGDPRFREAAVANGRALDDEALRDVWCEIERSTGCRRADGDAAGRHVFRHADGREQVVTLLPASVVFTVATAARLIRGGIDTVVGVTGLPAFGEADLDAFLARPNASGAAEDELVLISGSSKDYEFRRAIDVLNVLLMICSNRPAAPDEQLQRCQALSRAKLSVLRDDSAALDRLLAQPVTVEAVQAFIRDEPSLSAGIGLDDRRPAEWPGRLADFQTRRIRRAVTILKELRPDIGSIYHLVVNGQPKRLVLLADGFVVNFYARHEKGVKTEYIDSIVTMQLLGIVTLSKDAGSVPAALHKLETLLRPEDMDLLWRALEERCRPLPLA